MPKTSIHNNWVTGRYGQKIYWDDENFIYYVLYSTKLKIELFIF